MHLTYRYRVKDATTAKHLAAHARAVNFVWNYCCEVQRHAQKWRKRWPTWISLINLTAGTSKELGLHSDTIGEVCRAFAKARDELGRCPRWRSNYRSLGWIPFRARAIKLGDSEICYFTRHYRLWKSREIGGQIKTGSFVQDARGRWYVNLVCEVEQIAATGAGAVGVDLGLKALATLSDGSVIENQRHTARYAEKLAIAQRAGNRRRVAAINAKIANCRRDYLHKQSTRLVNTYQKIVVGNVSASGLAKTTMAKSVLDAGWCTFKEMLSYKMAIRQGAEYVEVNEANTTRTCSACGARSGPKGQKGLGIREWNCDRCGVVHDRDANAARNILLGAECRPPVEEIAA